MIFLLGIFFIIGIIQLFRGFCAIFDADLKKINESDESLWHYLYVPATIFGHITIIVVLYNGCRYLIN